MFAKIYQPSPNAMQSGRAQSRYWVLKFMPTAQGYIDPLTGCMRSSDMRQQIELKFATLEEAVGYAKAHKIAHRVVKPRTVKKISRSYSENFDYDRKQPWTH